MWSKFVYPPSSLQFYKFQLITSTTLLRRLTILSPSPSPATAMSTSPPPIIHSLSFNQNSTWLYAATSTGFLICTTNPLRLYFHHTFNHPLSLINTLFSSNILSLVNNTRRKVIVWDTHRSCHLFELSCRSEVQSVRLRRDRIIVALLRTIDVYNFNDLKLLDHIETYSNPKGLCEVSYLANSVVLVCPGLHKGEIKVVDYESKKTNSVLAHQSEIACIALTLDASLVVTASCKGTLIRVFRTSDLSLLHQVRRGIESAEIHSLAFSIDAQWLAASSDRGTVHVFNLNLDLGSLGNCGSQNSPVKPSSPRSPLSSIAFIKGALPNYFISKWSMAQFRLPEGALPNYFSSKWSMAQFRLPEGTQYIVSFGDQEHTVIIAGMNGSFYRCSFDPIAGGEMRQLEYRDFLNPEVEAFGT